MSLHLQQKIKNKSAVVAVMGLGYVGLPLAVNFAKKGLTVYGLDNDADRVRRVQAAQSYISDIPSSVLKSVVEAKKLIASLDVSLLAKADAIIICVPTPLKRKYTPDISFILSAVKTIAQYLKKGSLVVLESTTYPGTTEELIKPALERQGLKAEKDFYLAFSPERIDPGNKNYDVTRIPKLVGGMSKKSGELTQLLYQQIIREVHLLSSAKAAEMTKLLENSFRIINIGWINEVAMMCHKMDIDIWEVIEGAKTKPFGFMPFYPGLGVGGHCIPDDPLYLYWKAKHHGFSSKFIKLSADINSSMPKYAVENLRSVLAKKKIDLRKSRLLVVGVTYKKDVKDLRKSPPLKLIELLQASGADVSYSDPLIPYLDIGPIHLKPVILSSTTLKKFDVVIIATDHTTVDYALILRSAKLIYDIKNIYGKKVHPKVVKF